MYYQNIDEVIIMLTALFREVNDRLDAIEMSIKESNSTAVLDAIADFKLALLGAEEIEEPAEPALL